MNFSDFLNSLNVQSEEEARGVASLRPTLYIGLGGFGCATIRNLKARIQELIPEHADGFAFLGMDTHTQPLEDVLTTNEYVALSIGVDPNEAARSEAEYLSWYRDLTGAYKARNITSGADETKALGRLAFRYAPTFQEFVSRLNLAYDQLGRFRDRFARGAPPKVYVIATPAGGTGAGCLLDVMFVTGKFFRDNAGADFPYQAILVTPDALLGEAPMGHMPRFYANTYATIKELHSFLTSSEEPVVSYDNGRYQRLRLNRTLLPNPIHLIGDRNEAGTSVADKLEGLSNIVVSYLLSEIQTPMRSADTGTPKVQDMENTEFANPGREGMPRAISSFGVVRTGIPADIVENLFALRLIHAALDAELQTSPNMFEAVSNWVDAHHLKERGTDTDQLQDLIRTKAGDALRFATDARGYLLKSGFKYKRLPSESRQFMERQREAFEADKHAKIEEVGSVVIDETIGALQQAFDERLRQGCLGDAMAFLSNLEATLKQHQEALAQETTEARALQNKREQEVKLGIQSIGEAAQGWLGRKRRVEQAVDNFDARLEKVFESDLDLWIKEKADGAYVALVEQCRALLREWAPVAESTGGHVKNIEAYITQTDLRLEQLADIGKRGAGNRFSLVNAHRAGALYEELIRPGQAAAIQRLRRHWLAHGSLGDTKSTTETWLGAVAPHVIDTELRAKLQGLHVNAIFQRFYHDEGARRRLFQDLQSLSSPLFWLDPNRKEAHYDAYWIIALHPELKDAFQDGYEQYLPGQGRIYAYFDSPHEIVLYQIKYGYTIYAYHRLDVYEADYARLQEAYQRGQAEKRPIKPVHGWPEANRWDELIPNPEEEEGLKWFILGRAFSHLYPSPGADEPTSRKNKAFLYARGSNYYLQTQDRDRHKEERVGKGLEEAVQNFSERPDWQEALRKNIEAKVAEVGEQQVWEQLKNEYLPLLDEEYETALRTDPHEHGRAGLLNGLRTKLQQYRDELRTVQV